jgi:hypothetical protein
MPLVHSAVCREKVEIVLAFGVPNRATACSREDYTRSALYALQKCIAHTNWQRVVVVRRIFGLRRHGFLRRRSMVFGGVWGACRVE